MANTLQDYTFLFNRKGALYPIDYDDNGDLTSKCKLTSLNLVGICCKYIINNRGLFKYMLNGDESSGQTTSGATIPREIFTSLLRATLEIDGGGGSVVGTMKPRDDIIDELINKWPFRRLVVSSYVQKPSISLLYNDIDMYKYTRIGIKYTADIIHSFIESLRKHRTKLRYLDLTNLPIAEILIKYIATHSRLAQKEFQRNLLIDEYLKNISDLQTMNSQMPSTSSNMRTDLKKSTSLPNEPLIFRFDCLIQERSTYDELMSALNTEDHRHCFELNIIKLDVLCLGVSNVIKLLNKLDHKSVEGLRLQYNSIKQDNLYELMPQINLLTNLKSIDLSCNLIDLRTDEQGESDTICFLLNDSIVNHLPHLDRIDLSNCKLTNKIEKIFARWPANRSIEYLCLKSCGGLTESDLKYLTKMNHACGLNLRHLNLCDNYLNKCLNDLFNFLLANRNSIAILELDDNHFNSIEYLNLINFVTDQLLLSTYKLKLLSIKGKYHQNDHIYSAFKLASCFLTPKITARLPPLLIYRISYPIDVYLNDDDDNDRHADGTGGEQGETNKRIFLNKLLNIIQNKFKFVLHELFL